MEQLWHSQLSGQLSPAAINEAHKLIADPLLFIARVLKIQDKAGQIIPLQFNAAQLAMHQEIERQRAAAQPIRLMILKARQMGFSTAISGQFYYHTATKANRNAAIIAHKSEASANIFLKQKLFWELSPPALRPQARYANSREMVFEMPAIASSQGQNSAGLRSAIRVETAGSKDALRSATIHYLHCSEVAFWPFPQETMTSVLQTVPHLPETMVILESTAGGIGGYFYEEWQRACQGNSEFMPLFFPWFAHDAYRLPLTEKLRLSSKEKELRRRFNLDYEQINWRRWCIKANCGGNVDIFNQEYPAAAEEAFAASGRPVFAISALDMAWHNAPISLAWGRVIEADGRVEFREGGGDFLKIWQYPVENEQYIIGIDVAEGKINGDYSVMSVINRKNGEQVAEWHGHIDPDLLGEEACLLGRYYNRALLIPEINNHGIATVQAIRRLNYGLLWKRRTIAKDNNYSLGEYGFRTDMRSKPLIINQLAAFIREDAGRIKSKATLQECMSYAYQENGSTNARAGCYDDRVMALALAIYAISEHPFDDKPLTDIYQPGNKTTGY